jgi:hypothetical protein
MCWFSLLLQRLRLRPKPRRPLTAGEMQEIVTRAVDARRKEVWQQYRNPYADPTFSVEPIEGPRDTHAQRLEDMSASDTRVGLNRDPLAYWKNRR